MGNSDLTYRMLAGADMAKVRLLLGQTGEPSPHFLLSCAWVAENPKGEIVALSVMQSVPIIEPFKMIAGPGDGYDGGKVLGELFDMTREFVVASGTPRVLMHTGHPAMQRMLTRKVKADRMCDEFFDWRAGRR